MEKDTQKPVSVAVWLFTPCNTGATTYGERSTWECGYVFILFSMVSFSACFELLASSFFFSH